MVDSVVVSGRLPNIFPEMISKNNLEASCPSSYFFIVRYFWVELNFYRLRTGFYVARFGGVTW